MICFEDYRILIVINLNTIPGSVQNSKQCSNDTGSLRHKMPVKSVSQKRRETVEQTDKPENVWHDKASNALERAKMHFDSSCTIVRNQAKIIFDKMDHLSGHSSAGYAAVAVIKILAIFFLIIVVVECIFHFRSYFWLLCGYMCSLLYFAVVIVVRGANMILVSAWAIFKYVFFSIGKMLLAATGIAIYYLKSSMLFVLNGVVIFEIPTRWTSNLSINAIVKVIKTVAILFMLRSFTYFLHLVVAYIIRVPSIIWENVVAILEYVRNANSEIFLALTRLAFKCLTSISSLSSNCCTVTYYQINLISNSVVSLTNSWNGILLVCFLFGVLMLVLLLRATAFTSNLLGGNVLAVEW